MKNPDELYWYPGVLLFLAGLFWAIYLQFQKSTVRGAVSLIFPVLVWFDMVTDPRRMWRPMVVCIVGVVVIVAGVQLGRKLE